MKCWKKMFCLLLCLVLMTGLMGCGSFTARMASGGQKMTRMQSLHSDTVITADLTLSVLGQEMPAALKVHILGDHQKEPALNAFDVELSAMDFTDHVLGYLQETEDGFAAFVSWDDGKTWMETGLSPSKAEEANDPAVSPALSAGDLINAALALSVYFEDAGSVTLTDSAGLVHEGIRYEGVLPAELLQKALSSVNLDEKLDEAFPLQFKDEYLALVGELPVALVLDKSSNMVLRVELDLTQALGPLAEQFFRDLAANAELLDMAVDLSIDRITVSSDLSRFDQVTVTLPEMDMA